MILTATSPDTDEAGFRPGSVGSPEPVRCAESTGYACAVSSGFLWLVSTLLEAIASTSSDSSPTRKTLQPSSPVSSTSSARRRADQEREHHRGANPVIPVHWTSPWSACSSDGVANSNDDSVGVSALAWPCEVSHRTTIAERRNGSMVPCPTRQIRRIARHRSGSPHAHARSGAPSRSRTCRYAPPERFIEAWSYGGVVIWMEFVVRSARSIGSDRGVLVGIPRLSGRPLMRREERGIR